VLRDYGNMSSATVMFVLKHILESPFGGMDERICSMAFGPGLTVETGLFTKTGAATAGTAAAQTDTSAAAAL
jgi:predicted naringenin-chalcone synthase